MNLFARGTAAALLVLMAAGCAAEEVEGSSGSTVPSLVSPTPMNDGSSTPLSSVSPSAVADVMVEVTIASGRVTPNGANIGVAVGQTVQVSAGSDVEDSLHVHGYDKTLTLSPGETSAVSFVADQSGVFEIKTHESGKPVAKLIVS